MPHSKKAVMALSSGEAEYCGLVSAACNALGEQSTLKDRGVLLPIQAFMDANTGLIDAVFLWVQDIVSSGKVVLAKKHTDEMLAVSF